MSETWTAEQLLAYRRDTKVLTDMLREPCGRDATEASLTKPGAPTLAYPAAANPDHHKVR